MKTKAKQTASKKCQQKCRQLFKVKKTPTKWAQSEPSSGYLD